MFVGSFCGNTYTDFQSLHHHSSCTKDCQTEGAHFRGVVCRIWAQFPEYLTPCVCTAHTDRCSEKKIDRIEERLSGIENVLAKLALKLGDLDLQTDSTERSSQSRRSRMGSRVESGKSPTLATESTLPAPFEGETAINSQSVHARELLAKVVDNTPSIGQNEEIKSALSALGDIVTRQGHVTVSTTATATSLINRALSDVDPARLERPPWPAVKDMLEKALGRLRSSCTVPLGANTSRIPNDGVRCHLSFSEDAQSV